MDGWKTPIKGIKRFEDLPANAKNYMKKLEELVQVRMDIVSTGPERENTLVLNNPFAQA